MVGTVLGYAETFSTLLRHYNRGTISAATLAAAKSLLRLEIVEDPGFSLLSVDDTAVFAGVPLMEAHNLNATDAAILAVFLRYAESLPAPAPQCVMIACDHRLLSAARSEGLPGLNPEAVAPDDLPAVLAEI